MDDDEEASSSPKPHHKEAKGSNLIVEAEDYTTVLLDGHVKLRIPVVALRNSGLSITQPRSVPGLLRQIALHYAHADALAWKVQGVWHKITYAEYHRLVKTCAKAFLAVGLERHHSVAIVGFNSVEWFVSYLGAIYAGGIAVGIASTNSTNFCLHCIRECRADIVIVGGHHDLLRIVRKQKRNVKACVQYGGEPSSVAGVLTWQDLMDLGSQNEGQDKNMERVRRTMAVNECCVVVYTSGTTGQPKGVMLSHDNVTWSCWCASLHLKMHQCKEKWVSYMPMGDIVAQTMDIHCALTNAACVYFAPKDCIVEQDTAVLLDVLREVKPDRFLATPTYWERTRDRIKHAIAEKSAWQKMIFKKACQISTNHHMKATLDGHAHDAPGFGFRLVRALVLHEFRKQLGLEKCITAASCAAPLSNDVTEFFLSIDLPIVNTFGLCECSGPHAMCTAPHTYGSESIGSAIPDMKSRIALANHAGEGELLLYGRHIFMGYVGDIAKTQEAVDKDGWLHTGDLGRMDRKLAIHLSGRTKDLIVMADGERAWSGDMERSILTELPAVSHAVVVGDRRPCLAVLLTLKTWPHVLTGAPTQVLTDPVRDWLGKLNCDAATVDEVLAKGPDGRLIGRINEALDKVNRKAVSQRHRLRGFAILPRDFSLCTGELTPNMKPKRSFVAEMYGDLIDKMYKTIVLD